MQVRFAFSYCNFKCFPVLTPAKGDAVQRRRIDRMREAGDKCPKCGASSLSEHTVLTAKTGKVESKVLRCSNAECGYWSDATSIRQDV